MLRPPREDPDRGSEIGTHPGDGRVLVQAESRAEWRAWFERDHAESSGCWLVSWKKASGKPFIPYTEALCFGWVDSRPNRLDEQRAMRLFTPRNPASPWSRLNTEKVARLTREGLMAPAGAGLVEEAKANGSWSVYDEVEALVIPSDLAAALAANEPAGGFFAAFPDSSKKTFSGGSSRRAGPTRARRASGARPNLPPGTGWRTTRPGATGVASPAPASGGGAGRPRAAARSAR